MRVVALLFLLGTVSDVATAQTSECQSIPKASDRLACYDKATPPAAVEKARSVQKLVLAAQAAELRQRLILPARRLSPICSPLKTQNWTRR